jgi:hypothetical protein
MQLVLSVNKGPFRSLTTPQSDSVEIWMSNRLRSLTKSLWKADQYHKCVVLRCAWFFASTVAHRAHVLFSDVI